MEPLFGAWFWWTSLPAIVTTRAATLLMMTSRQTALAYGLPFGDEYYYVNPMRIFAYANVIACLFAMPRLLFFIIGHERLIPRYFLLFIRHWLLMSLLLWAVAGMTAVQFGSHYINNQARWMPSCDHLSELCEILPLYSKFSYRSFLVLLLLMLITTRLVQI
ncbi:hypothetical protein SLA2020_509320 [Shorea laevis]